MVVVMGLIPVLVSGVSENQLYPLQVLYSAVFSQDQWVLQVFRAVQRHITSQRVSTGSWSSWSGWSRCSSTCGRGLRTQVRKCVGQGKTNLCRGVSSRHHVCDNMPCKAGVMTHTSQCAEYDREEQHWVASYNNTRPAPDRCHLICKLGDTGDSKTMSLVRDGTDCMPRDRHRVCVQGKCQVRALYRGDVR